MIYHVLPGDSLVETFGQTGLDGKTIVFREALITGDLDAPSLDEFWDIRANYLALEYGEDPIDYREKVAYEIEKLLYLNDADEVSLWFEFELFCSVNYWFCLDLLKNSRAAIFRVAPINLSPDQIWKGFGVLDADDLIESYAERAELTTGDIELGSELWQAFVRRDAERLRTLGEHRSPAFPFLKEVTDAASAIETRPAEIIDELKANGFASFEEIFPEFQKRAGVFGFGDTQVERLLERD